MKNISGIYDENRQRSRQNNRLLVYECMKNMPDRLTGSCTLRDKPRLGNKHINTNYSDHTEGETFTGDL